jgi:Pyridoxamine 5'-phosphate oxidase
LSIFRGPLCETRQVIHGPDHFKINWFPCTLHFSGKRRVYRGSLQPGDIHMGILTDDMKRIVREQQLGYIATVCPDGTPNLWPKGTTAVWDDDHLVFADIRSPQSVENINHHPSVEVNVVDPLVRKGYRFKGRAVVHRSDEVFQRYYMGCSGGGPHEQLEASGFSSHQEEHGTKRKTLCVDR